jgi:hypothetical protein
MRTIVSMPFVALLLITYSFAAETRAQTANLLRNPAAAEGTRYWRTFKGAAVEEWNGERVFVLRDGGYFIQDVILSKGSVGKYAVFTASGPGDAEGGAARAVPPCLSGYMMNAGAADGGRIYAYLNGQRMCHTAGAADGSGRAWGIFRVPEGTERIRFFIQQPRQGGEQIGAASLVKSVGLHLFSSEAEARTFVGPEADSLRAEEHSAVPPCTRPPSQAPELYGLRLGMKQEELFALFPGLEDKKDVRWALDNARSPKGHGEAWLRINPHEHFSESFADTGLVYVRLLDERVYSISIEYGGPVWSAVDEFISSRAASWGLPPAESWHKVLNNVRIKYLMCDGFAVSFYAAPERATSRNNVHLVDTAAEEVLAGRKTGADGDAR